MAKLASLQRKCHLRHNKNNELSFSRHNYRSAVSGLKAEHTNASTKNVGGFGFF